MADGPKILVVDDEPNIRDLLTTSLRFAGFMVRAVGTGAQTISAVLEEEPDLIVLDVMLPDINGFGVTKRLRSSGYTCPILFLTAKDSTEDKITGLTVGGDDYVTKPFSLDEIVARSLTLAEAANDPAMPADQYRLAAMISSTNVASPRMAQAIRFK